MLKDFPAEAGMDSDEFDFVKLVWHVEPVEPRNFPITLPVQWSAALKSTQKALARAIAVVVTARTRSFPILNTRKVDTQN